MEKTFKSKIVLVGMMGSGKTTIGKLLSKDFSLPFYDSDEEIVKKLGMSIVDIFQSKGEEVFREEEAKTIKKILIKDQYICALGGGSLLNQEIRDIVKKNVISIWLQASVDDLYERLKDDKSRPKLDVMDTRNEIFNLNQQREKFYKMSDIVVNTGNKSEDMIISEIVPLIEDLN
ncbi:MAG: shikimate kinase [Rhodobiaceae bacterium]|nr:shikimate kinase [Rhodobiaceae bacterium]